MSIEFTKEQYEELLLLMALGLYAREAAAEGDAKREAQALAENLEPTKTLFENLLRQAGQFGLEGLVADEGGKPVPSEEFAKKIGEIMNRCGDAEFWHRLETYMGERDFYRYATEEEVRHAEETGQYPEKVHWYYGKYAREFEENGLDRLEISEDE